MTSPPTRVPRWPLAAALAVALLVRLFAWSRTVVMMNDGPDFLWQAARLLEGDWAAALSHPYHPLYGALTALVSPAAGGDLALAGLGVSMASGLVLVLASWSLARRLFPGDLAAPGWAALAAAVMARAVNLTADVQSDGLFGALALVTLATLTRAWDAWSEDAPGAGARGARALGLAGLLTGLAYLTRPEGLFLLLPALVVALAAGRRGVARGPRLAGAALGLGAVLLCALPYILTLHELTGVWGLSLKPAAASAGLNDAEQLVVAPPGSPLSWPIIFRDKSAPAPGRRHAGTSLFDDEPGPSPGGRTPDSPLPGDTPPDSPAADDPTPVDQADLAWPLVLGAERPSTLTAAGRTLGLFVHAARLELLLLAIPGAVFLRRRRRDLFAGLALVVLGWLAAATLQVQLNGYLTNRHLMLALVPLLPVAGGGLCYAASARWPVKLLALLCLAETLRAGTAPQRTQVVPRLEALAWVNAHTSEHQAFATHRRRDGFYASRTAVTTRMPVKPSSFRKQAATVDIAYMVWDLEDVQRHQADWLSAGHMREVARFGEGEDVVVVYEPRLAPTPR